jgi:hypothetical protein
MTQEAEIRWTAVQSQPREIVCETLSQKKSQKRAGEFQSQYHKKKKEK